MRATATIMKRELFAFFVSPMAYVVLTVWLAWNGITLWTLTEFYAKQAISSGTDSPLTAFFGGTLLFFIPIWVFVPLLTMRLLAGEKQKGTLEPLLTTAISEAAVAVGKYLAVLVMWVAMWLPTLMYVWIISRYGSVDLGATAGAYSGILMIGVYYLSVGLLTSALAPNQMIAAVLSFLVLGVLFVVGIGEFVLEGFARDVAAYLSVWSQMATFSKGVIDSRYLVLDVSIAVFCVALTIGVLKARKFS